MNILLFSFPIIMFLITCLQYKSCEVHVKVIVVLLWGKK